MMRRGLNAFLGLFWLQQLLQSRVDDADRAVSLRGDSKFSLVYLTQTQPPLQLQYTLQSWGS